MACFGIETKNAFAQVKVIEIVGRLKCDDFIKNPFKSKVKQYRKNMWAVCIEPLYPQFYLWSIFPAIIYVMFPGFWFGKASLAVALVMFSLAVFWANWFYFLMFAFVTKGGVRYVSKDKLLWQVV